VEPLGQQSLKCGPRSWRTKAHEFAHDDGTQ
jgi:hypothetical protein